MTNMRERAREIFPSILLTILSIVQALALELLWGQIHESAFLWLGGWAALIGWTQVATLLTGLLQVWLYYVSIVMRFRWVPSTWDSVIPFGIGILEFALIELLRPDFLGAWFCVLALLFGVSLWTSHNLFQRARVDPANREFFDRVRPARLADFAPGLASIAGLVATGLLLELAPAPAWLVSRPSPLPTASAPSFRRMTSGRL